MGLIYVLRPLGAVTFSKPDQRILAAFAEQAAIALQNTRLARLLAEEKQRVESILEGSADGIMSIDAQRRLVGFNAAMERLTGYSREEVLGKECLKILNLRDATGKILCNRQCPMLMSSMKGNFIFEQQGAIRTKAGKDVEVAMTYAIVTSTEGKPVNAVVNVRDISRLKELEDLRETFLTMLGHELQTPLSIIKGYANTLSRSDGRWNKETLHQGLSVIEEESDRLSKVVDRLLLASRISTGALTLEKEPTQLPPLVSKVVRRFQTVTNIHTFEVDFEPDFPSILADPGLIEEVLVNLAENAVKYSPEGGRIIISGRHNNKQVTITVTDEGIGIAPEDMERIFERFGRAETGRARNIKGMGLGLHICKSIIQAHVGTIEAVSKPGKGSQFIFTLPLE